MGSAPGAAGNDLRGSLHLDFPSAEREVARLDSGVASVHRLRGEAPAVQRDRLAVATSACKPEILPGLAVDGIALISFSDF